MTRTCIGCAEKLPIESFPIHNGTSRRTRCSDCYRVYNTDTKRKAYTTEKNRRTALMRKYALTLEQYDAMLVSQRGLCALCEKPEVTLNKDGSPRYLAVDHDHNCCPGQITCGNCVRGLLCYKCNCLLGNAQDNLEVLKRAIAYLEDFK